MVHLSYLATTREGAGTGWGASTRYVYDGKDRLAAVIGAGIAVTDTLSMWRYGYDQLGRLRSKGVPGSVREYYTYDSEDRIISITRGNEVTTVSYDSFGRVTSRSLKVGTAAAVVIETHEYDAYSSAATTLIGGSSYTSGPKKGLETWSSYAVTDGQGGFSGTASTAYAYDALGRLTRSVTQYPDGHKNTTVITYDFAGNPASTVVTGVRPGGSVTDVLSVTTTYDTRERPSSTVSVLTIGGVEKARNTTTYSYDALGRQSAVSSGPASSAGLVESQYAYTLQQWTSSIATALGGRTVFSETLGYDSPSGSLGGPSYTGLITRKGETWSIPTSPTQSQSVSRTEDYVYDYAARLSAWDDSTSGENISYDARGNITQRVPRHGSGGTVTQTYTGDRLATRKVGAAAAVSFAHDSFARMTTDAEAGLSITYNPFDLPEQLSQGTTLKAKYTYLADGTKVSALDASGAGLVYRGPFTYRRSSGGTLAFESAPFDRGRLTAAGVRYHVTDHLGSVRAVIDGNASTTTYPLTGFYSVDDFAPFGTRSTSSASSYLSLASTGSTVSLRDGFTGQEDQGPDFGVGYSDFGARQYSPSLSRWLVPDPMGEKYYDVSPYVYCAGNPINSIDILGLTSYNVKGDYYWIEDGYDEIIQISRKEYRELQREWNRGLGESYDNLRSSLMDKNGYIDSQGNAVLSASVIPGFSNNTRNQLYSAFALTLTTDVSTIDPSDAELYKWGAYAVGGAVLAIDYYIQKKNAEISHIERRPDGPNGVQYSLRAISSGYFPNVRGGSVYLNAGEVWKYGETTLNPPESRYRSKEVLRSMNLFMYKEASGSQRQMKIEEKHKLCNV